MKCFSVFNMLESEGNYAIVSRKANESDTNIEPISNLNAYETFLKFREMRQEGYDYIDAENIENVFKYQKGSYRPVSIMEERDLGLGYVH